MEWRRPTSFPNVVTKHKFITDHPEPFDKPVLSLSKDGLNYFS